YIEALVEGGVPRLGLSLLGILLVYRLGWRALRRHAGRSAEVLALGALLGFTTVVLHSLVDFGVHMPAVALLTTVVCAMLAGVGDGDAPAPSRWSPASVLGAAVAVTIAGLLFHVGWRGACAEWFRATGTELAASARDR